jgi:DNA-3-methyladenine glycosylase II
LLVANDDELFELLTAVYGIGKWTVEMFAIFSLRRPDILPVGDLGVQRGLLRWMLSLHQPEYRIELSPKKLPDPTEDPRKAEDAPKQKPIKSRKKVKGGVSASNNEIDSDQEVEQEADELPSSNGLPDATASRRQDLDHAPTTSVIPAVSTTATTSDVQGTPLRRNKKNLVGGALTPGALGLPSMPPPLTPSVTQALTRAPDAPPPPPLPAGLTVSSLRSRLDGKKKIKGAILTPSEMEALTEPWRPYRSIGKLTRLMLLIFFSSLRRGFEDIPGTCIDGFLQVCIICGRWQKRRQRLEIGSWISRPKSLQSQNAPRNRNRFFSTFPCDYHLFLILSHTNFFPWYR